MGCLRVWCAYCMLKIWKSNCIKELRYLPEGKTTPTIVICKSFMFITAGINSPFTAWDMFCQSKTQLPNTVSYPSRVQIFVCVSLFNIVCCVSPPVPHCSVSSAPQPLVSGDTWERKQEKARWESPDETGWWSTQREEVNLLRCLLLDRSSSGRLQRPSSLNVRFHLYKYYNENSSSVNLHPQSKWDRLGAEER